MFRSENVAVIMLNWNNFHDTIECIESVFFTHDVSYKVFLLDNGSDNNSFSILNNSFSNLSAIKIIRSESNLGFAAGNNLLIKLAIDEGFDFIWLLNNDTTVLSNTMSNLLSCINKPGNINVGVLGSILYEYYNPWQIQAYGGGRYNKVFGLASSIVSQGKVDHIIGASMFFRTAVLKKVGLLDERLFFYLEDTEISLRVKDFGYGIGVCEDSFVFHKGGSSVNTGNRSKSERSEKFFIRSVIKFMEIRKYAKALILARLIIMFFNRLTKLEFRFSIIVVEELFRWIGENNAI